MTIKIPNPNTNFYMKIKKKNLTKIYNLKEEKKIFKILFQNKKIRK